MNPKNGFLLIELMIGLTLAFFFILISSHYIIQLKNIQLGALRRIEALSLARTYAEKMNAGQSVAINHPFYTIKVSSKPNNHKVITMNDIAITWTMHNQKHAVNLSTYSSIK